MSTFLLSPAHSDGERARLLRKGGANFDLARRLRQEHGAPLGEVFSFLSGLYFRGKLAYARAFATSPADILVITPSDGLLAPETRVGLDDLSRYAAVPVDARDERYWLPLLRDCTALARRGLAGEVVLLGSLAPQKYLEVLVTVFGDGVYVPRDFIGRGDMSRGALLLRCVREQWMLDYVRASEVFPWLADSIR